MLKMLKRPALAAALLGFSPMAALLGGAITETQAHTYGPPRIVISAPVPVFGFSYQNPYVYGHVHYSPVQCSQGPIYYYPAHHVYAHQYPAYQYQRYARPVYGHSERHHHDYLPPHVQFIRNRLHRHLDHLRGDWDDD